MRKRRAPAPTADQVRLLLRSARTSYISALVKAHEALDDGRRADLLAEAERLDAQIDQLEQLQARLESPGSTPDVTLSEAGRPV